MPESNASPNNEVTHTSPGEGGPWHGGAQVTTLPPDAIAGYEILGEIHRGGQGVVYQAIQKSTRRKVAIKVMKEGPFAGPSDKARFDREVQVLAQLNHPNVVTIHDSGLAAGHFYFVMDYIAGLPLDAYMAGGKRSIEDTLRLFARICDAVNAAHLRGIIHRDLKPGNIRVDSDGNPHVLDFGLAKLSLGEATDATQPAALSITGQFIGSLPWASPEQAEGIPGNVDVRTDVYSLGVILYQMLTGRFPYEVIGNMRDVLDRIIGAEPARPSTIRRQINDEVETIVLKCLGKSRDRRYQNAGELARDIGHYLAGEPIEAKRDSAWYVLRKHVQRHKIAALVAIVFAFVLIAFAVTSSIQADRNRMLANDARGRLSDAMVERGMRLLDNDDQNGLLYLLEARTLVDHDPELSTARAGLWGAWHQGLEDRFVHAIGGPEPITAFHFSADGNHIITGAKNLVTTWDIATGQRAGEPIQIDTDEIQEFIGDGNILLTRKGQGPRISNPYWDLEAEKPRDRSMVMGSVNFVLSPDGHWQFRRTWEGDASVTDVRKGKIHGKPWYCESSFVILEVVHSPDGQFLATRGQELRLWNVSTGQRWGESLDLGRNPKVAFTPDGRFLAVRTLKNFVGTGMLVDLATEKPHGNPLDIGGDVPDHSFSPPPLFSPDGKLLAMQCVDKVYLWDVESTEPMGPPIEHGARVGQVIFSRDGKLLATAGADNAVRIWDIPGGQPHGTPLEHQQRIARMQFSPDGAILATLESSESPGKAAQVRLWSSTGARQPGEKVLPHSADVTAMDFNDDGKFLATASADSTVRVTDLATMEPVGSPIHEAASAVALSRDGKLLATAGWGRRSGDAETFAPVRVWDVQSGNPVDHAFAMPATTSENARDHLTSLAFSPDGHLLAGLSGRAGTVALWDTSTGQLRGAPLEPEQPMESTWFRLRFSPKGDRVFASEFFGTWNVWEVSTGQLLRVDGMTRAVNADGRRLAVLPPRSKELQLHDAVKRETYGAPIPADDSIRALFSADGSRMAVVSRRSAAMYSGADGTRLGPQIQFPTQSAMATLSPDGRLLAVTLEDAVRIWETTTGQPYGSLRKLGGQVLDVQFSSDGRWLTTWSDTGESDGSSRGGYRLFRLSDSPADLRRMQLQTWLMLGARLAASGGVEAIPNVEFQRLKNEAAALGMR